MMKQMPDGAEGTIILSQEEIGKLQQVLLGILDDIVQVCEAYEISYTLGGGSVLGALRHEGFIPWDDDIDINMPRGDYMRFIPIFRRLYGHKYWIHTPEETRDYALPMAKIRKKGTIMRERDDFHSSECGVGIDIFIIENTFDLYPLRVVHGIGSLGFGFLLSCRKFYRDRKEYMKLAEQMPKVPAVFRIKILVGFLISFLSVDAWCHMANRWNSICPSPESIYVSGCGGRLHFFGELYRRADFCRTRKAVFEGRLVNIPLKAEAYLTHCYGSWQEIPPQEKREKHILFEYKI